MQNKHENKIDKFGDEWKWDENAGDEGEGAYVMVGSGDGWTKYDFGDAIWWRDTPPRTFTNEAFDFSFDKKKVFNLYTDYPEKLTPEQRKIFKKENRYLAEQFGGKDD